VRARARFRARVLGLGSVQGEGEGEGQSEGEGEWEAVPAIGRKERTIVRRRAEAERGRRGRHARPADRHVPALLGAVGVQDGGVCHGCVRDGEALAAGAATHPQVELDRP